MSRLQTLRFMIVFVVLMTGTYAIVYRAWHGEWPSLVSAAPTPEGGQP